MGLRAGSRFGGAVENFMVDDRMSRVYINDPSNASVELLVSRWAEVVGFRIRCEADGLAGG